MCIKPLPRATRAELEKLGPAKVATPEAKRAGELAAVFGANPTKVEAAMILVIPFLTTLFLELGSIICLGYGFRPVRKAPVNDNAQTSFDHFEPLPPARMIEPDLKGTNVVDWSSRSKRVHGRSPALTRLTAAFLKSADQPLPPASRSVTRHVTHDTKEPRRSDPSGAFFCVKLSSNRLAHTRC
jgi:hypothetical protein